MDEKQRQIARYEKVTDLLKTIVEVGPWVPAPSCSCEFLDVDNDIREILEAIVKNASFHDFLDGTINIAPQFKDERLGVSITPGESDGYHYVYAQVPYYHQGSGPLCLSEKTLVRARNKEVTFPILTFNALLLEQPELLKAE